MADPGEIVAWTIERGLEGTSQADLVAGYCERLVDAGLPLWRAAMGSDTLHPTISVQGHHWLSEDGLHEEFYPREASPERDAEWQDSPWHRMIENGESHMRRRLMLGEGTNEFPLLAGLAERGGTDYWARIVPFGERARLGEASGLAMSWTTRLASGFAEHDIRLIEATVPAFALAFKATMGVETAHTLMTTYLGREPAGRVLRGEIERGKVNTEQKVLWFSDLIGFTRTADLLPREQLLDLLNAYADCLVGIVHAHGGEVLKFMGDGILAVFDGGESHGCRRALDAAEAARVAVTEMNRRRSDGGQPTTGFTLALHAGEVLYGNIGSQERLDFTVVGPAVNEVTRIQGISRSLDQPVLVSASFAEACGEQRARLISLGRYALRGVERPQELFTLDVSPDRASGQAATADA